MRASPFSPHPRVTVISPASHSLSHACAGPQLFASYVFTVAQGYVVELCKVNGLCSGGKGQWHWPAA